MNCLNSRETEGKKGRDMLFFLWQLNLDSAKRQGVYAYFKQPTHFSTPAAEARLMFTLIESWRKFVELIVWLSISSFPSRSARKKGHVPISRTETQKCLRSDPPSLGLFSSSYNITSILCGESPLKIKTNIEKSGVRCSPHEPKTNDQQVLEPHLDLHLLGLVYLFWKNSDTWTETHKTRFSIIRFLKCT